MSSALDTGLGNAANTGVLGENLGRWPTDKRLSALAMIVHCADLGNPGKPLRLSLNWCVRLLLPPRSLLAPSSPPTSPRAIDQKDTC